LISGRIGDIGDILTFLLKLPPISVNYEILAAHGTGVVNHCGSSIPLKTASSAPEALVTSSVLLNCGRLYHKCHS